METGRFLSLRFVIVALTISVAFLGLGLYAGIRKAKKGHGYCPPSSCGNIYNISQPFRVKHDPKKCGKSKYELSCENNVTVLYLYSGKYYVRAINYHNNTIRVVDPGIQHNNCSSMPRYSLANYNFSNWRHPYQPSSSSTPITFLKCANVVNSSLYLDTAPCISSGSSNTLIKPKAYGYVKVGSISSSDLEDGCGIEQTAMITSLYDKEYQHVSYQYIYSALEYGFELDFGLTYYFDSYPVIDPVIMMRSCIVLLSGTKFILGAPFVIALLIYKWRRRHLSMYSTIEEFLESENNLMPIRYSYSDIKKMSSKFREKLGKGGYGSVYKGKLRSGRFVAIKMLGNSKRSNGQDFVSEVATIGRIHNVNVVHLVGYCVEGSKRALVYEFMANGSLEKYIYSENECIPLSCQKVYEISLGVARGIEYLHQGCDMQILHFDIKPHNILLDDNFIPKISDFGLAKLYPTENSIVSLTAARGTMGYIAPELFYKNIGGVSHKADVYSFGMLLMEMASRRKNLNAFAEHSSQIHFPSWVYHQYSEGKELQDADVSEEEKKITRKMVIVALWCIQMKPSDRPSMNKVIQMLEGDTERLQVPPKPFVMPQEMPSRNIEDNGNSRCSNAMLTWTLSAR